jgi:DNA-binding transcriptional MerR regulator
MSKTNIPKFLMSAFNMVKRGDIKSLDDLFKFAKQEFGEITSSLKNQIEDVFTKGKAAAVTEKRTKDIMKEQDVGGEKGLISLADELQEKGKDLKKTLDESEKTRATAFENMFDAMTGFRRPTGSKDKLKPFQTPGMPYQRENPGYRTLGGSMYAEGNLRTAMREFLKTEVKEGRLKLNERDLFRITEYSPMSADDPIDVFRRYYGEDALEAADAMASKLEKGTSFKNYEEIFRANMPELKIKTEGAGQYDQSIIDAEAAMKQAAEDEKNLQKLEEFDVEGRTKNSKGGINRVGFARGKIKLAQFFYGKGTDLITEIRKAVNNIFESGDRKVDADVAVDDMLDEFGIDRDTVDQKDILQAYDEAYKTLSVPRGSRGGPDDIAAPVQSAEDVATSIKRNKDKQKVRKEMKEKYGFTDEKLDEIENTPVDEEMADRLIAETDLPKGVKAEDTILPTGDLVSRQIKIMNAADRIKPGLFENITEEQIDILVKYADRIDDDLLRNIVLDPDPNNRAAAVATLEQVDALMSEGKSMDEIMSILQSTPRRKQSEGGLSYLMGM